MKTIADCTPVEFLRRTNQIRHEASSLLKKTGVLELRKRTPELTGKETAQELKEKNMEQAKKNIDAMLDVLLGEDAEGTVRLLTLLCIPEPDEPPLTGMELFSLGMRLLSSKAVMDFLLSLMKLDQMILAA